MDSKQRHPVNLKQYRKVDGKWQFVPGAREAKGNPDLRLIMLDGEPASSKGGTFYLDFSEKARRRQLAVGTVPREALEARRTKPSILTGQFEPDPETPEEALRGLTTVISRSLQIMAHDCGETCILFWRTIAGI